MSSKPHSILTAIHDRSINDRSATDQSVGRKTGKHSGKARGGGGEEREKESGGETVRNVWEMRFLRNIRKTQTMPHCAKDVASSASVSTCVCHCLCPSPPLSLSLCTCFPLALPFPFGHFPFPLLPVTILMRVRCGLRHRLRQWLRVQLRLRSQTA